MTALLISTRWAIVRTLQTCVGKDRVKWGMECSQWIRHSRLKAPRRKWQGFSGRKFFHGLILGNSSVSDLVLTMGELKQEAGREETLKFETSSVSHRDSLQTSDMGTRNRGVEMFRK